MTYANESESWAFDFEPGYRLANKILRKFESLNLAFIRDEIEGLVSYLSELFGKENMGESKAYLSRLQKLF